MRKDAANILRAVSNFGTSMDNVRATEMMDLLESEGIILYRDKYGFIRFVNGYSRLSMKFSYVEAPLGYATDLWASCLHINKLGFQTESQKDFSDFEYFGYKATPLPKFYKWWLTKIMKVRQFTPTHPHQAKEEE